MSHANSFFDAVAGPPRPLQIDRLFGGTRAGSSYSSDTSQLLQELISQVNDQTSVLNELVGTVTEKADRTSFGGSVLGGVADAAQSGFSWQSVLKDIFPVGGLVSEISGLFNSAPTPPPRNQYDAPSALNFDAVLNANGTLSQGSTGQYGYTRGSSLDLDLTDSEGGPYSPYARASNGSLVPIAGDPTARYPGSLNLPELLRSMVPSPGPTAAPPVSQNAPVVVSPPANSSGVSAVANASLTADPTNATPTFDQQWFNDHGSLIASAVRTQLLNYHPIVDTINDL